MFSFQNPPKLVIDSILCYSFIYHPNYNKHFWIPMTLVCRSWRVAVMSHIFTRYTPKLKPDAISTLPLSLVPWFRNIHLSVNFPITDKDIKQSCTLVFSNTSSLQIKICYSYLTEFKPSAKELQQFTSNNAEFIDQIRQMVPNIRNVKVESNGGFNPTLYSNLQYRSLLTGLTSSIIQLATTDLDLECSCYIHGTDWDTINSQCTNQQLSNISITGNCDVRQFEIVRRSASTLQTLSTWFSDKSDDFSKLITDMDGNHITYPKLQSLDLKFDKLRYDADPVQYTKFSNTVVPFPNLQRLETQWDYQLGDDTLFRGNHHSLNYINIELTNATVEFLTDHQIFASGKYTKLEEVYVNMDSAYHDEFDSKCAKLAADMGRYAKILEFSGFPEGALDHAPVRYRREDDYEYSEDVEVSWVNWDNLGKQIAINFSNRLPFIEQLYLDNMYVAFPDAITLIKGLPSLRKLRINEIFSTDLPKDMVLDIFSPLSTKLKGLLIREVKESKAKEVARCLAKLAVLCPALEYICDGRGSIISTWAEAINEKEFEEYRDRLYKIELKNVY